MDTVLIFFIYGLAFFSMGLAILLEVGRAPLLAEARVLRPLAAFGLLHGSHEWLEVFLLQGVKLNVQIPAYWFWMRLGLLAVSFTSLVAYGVQVLRPPRRLAAMDAWVGGGLLALYVVVVAFTGSVSWNDFALWVNRADVLARYVLAVPGAIVAALALRLQAQQRQADGQRGLALSMGWAARGFAFYGFTQIFVTPVDLGPAKIINADLFLNMTGFPVQVLRAAIAFGITISLIRAMQIVEKERQTQLLSAQQDRLDALERVQDELVKREALRHELLRHTVIAQEEERARIARELHDETAQTLTAFSLDLATLQSHLANNPGVINIAKRLQSLCRQMSQDIYRLVRDLRPVQLDELGLISAIKNLIEENRRHIDVEFVVSGTHQRLDPLVETVIFRVVQEALTNIIRHAQVDRSTVHLSYKPDQVELRVQDLGVGFAVGERSPSQIGWGIAGMQERAYSVGGQFSLKSSLGGGTTVEVKIPLVDQQSKIDEESENENHSSIIG